jgi:hypothetical protein
MYTLTAATSDGTCTTTSTPVYGMTVILFVRETNCVGDDVGLQELGEVVGSAEGEAVLGDAVVGDDVGLCDSVGEAVGNLVEASMRIGSATQMKTSMDFKN